MKNSVKRIWTASIVVLAMLLAVCLVGLGIHLVKAHAQEEEPTSTVAFTSSTTVMKVGERFTFSATVTDESGSVSDSVTWSSSDAKVITITARGIAIARAEGKSTITATAADGAFASVDVYVSNSAIHVESIELYPDVLELGVGWKTRIRYTILPGNASDQRVAFASSDSSVITVDENGNVEALTAGTAIITVTAYDNGLSATCPVVIYANLGEATIAPTTLVTTIGQVTDNDLTVTLPDTVPEDAEFTYQWYSSYDMVASIGCCPPWCHCGLCGSTRGATAKISSWNFGTTTIYVVATYTPSEEGATPQKYAATATVHVTAPYFYLTGLVEDLDDPTGNPWVTYDTEEKAEAAGVLLKQSAIEPYVYSITRTFWANDYFQIIHGGINATWTTKITSTSFSEEGSTTAYVANNAYSFAVSNLGAYTVTLDLSDGPAKVTIEMFDLVVTRLNISVASYNAFLQYEGPESAEDPAATHTMLLNVETLPADAAYNLADVIVTLPEGLNEYVSAEPIQTEEDGLQIRLTLLKNYTDETDLYPIEIKVQDARAIFNVTILKDGEAYAPVTEVVFENAPYILNVNNGAKPWNTPINATVNSDASVKDVSYTCVYADGSENSHVWFEVINGQTYVHADALGTYTITATSLSNPEESASTTVLVTSLIETQAEEQTTYSTGFYLIGVLDGVEVADWTSISPEQTNFEQKEGQPFAAWTLPIVAGSDNKIYSATFNLRERDMFSIAFLGMNGSWWGIIDNEYMNWEDSTGSTYWNSGINIQISENGRYTITLNLSGERPSFTIERIGNYTPDVAYRMWLYIVRGCCSWDYALSQEQNVIARVGYIDILNGKAQNGLVLTSTAIDFYTFYTTTHEWPTIQFVTAIDWEYAATGENNYGIVGGYFQDPTWYGEVHQGVTFSGDAYIAPADVKEGDQNYFTNYRSQLYWVGEGENNDMLPATQEGQMTVIFTCTFDESGVLTKVELNFVRTPTEP